MEITRWCHLNRQVVDLDTIDVRFSVLGYCGTKIRQLDIAALLCFSPCFSGVQVSNLNRQFLFRRVHVDRPKSARASGFRFLVLGMKTPMIPQFVQV